MTPAEQIDALRKMASRKVANWLAGFSALVVVGAAIASIVSGNPICIMISVFAAIIALSARQAKPHIHRAAKSLDTGARAQGVVQITTSEWSDSVTCFATVENADDEKWTFEFIPLGWQPNEGFFDATLFRISDVAWPALIEIEQGILYPRSKPTLQ